MLDGRSPLADLPAPPGLPGLADLAGLDNRLRARLSPAEFFALAFALCLTLLTAFHWPPAGFHMPVDYGSYIQAARSDFSNYYYAYWFVPVLEIFDRLPAFPGFLLWSLLNLAGVFFAARTFGGKPAVVILSYQMLYSLVYGQIIGIILGGLALTWWGLLSRRWSLAGIGLIIAATKFQTGLIFALLLWLLADLTWKERLKVLAIPAAVLLISLFVYPQWPMQTLATIQDNPPNDWGNLALWRWMGPAALILWLPPMLMRLNRQKKLLAGVAASILAAPYFQQPDLLILFVLPVGWLPLLGYIALLHFKAGWYAFQILGVLPLLVYLAVILPALKDWWLAHFYPNPPDPSTKPGTG